MFKRFWIVVFAVWGVSAQAQNIQVTGDSVLVWNSWFDSSIAQVLAQEFGAGVVNNAVSGALVSNDNGLARFFGADIRSQYEIGAWDWVVINGGVNDIVTKCGCGACDAVLDELSSPDGRQGAMAEAVNLARDEGAQVVLLGNYLAPITGGPIWDCADDILELNTRYRTIADRDVDVYYVEAKSLISRHQLTLYDTDLIHLSVKGTRILAEAVSAVINEN